MQQSCYSRLGCTVHGPRGPPLIAAAAVHCHVADMPRSAARVLLNTCLAQQAVCHQLQVPTYWPVFPSQHVSFWLITTLSCCRC
jgi:hypothetical protein